MEAYFGFLRTLLLCGSILCGLGALGFWVHRSAHQPTENWPTVVGEVTSARLQEKRERKSNGGYFTNYYARIAYRYPVTETEGEWRTSREVRYGGDFYSPNKGEVEAFLRRFPDGNSVTVYLHPDDPRRSYLDLDLPDVVAIAPWSMLGLSGFGIGFFFMLRKMKTAQR